MLARLQSLEPEKLDVEDWTWGWHMDFPVRGKQNIFYEIAGDKGNGITRIKWGMGGEKGMRERVQERLLESRDICGWYRNPIQWKLPKHNSSEVSK